MIIENQKDAEFSSAFKPSQPVQASRFKRWLASMINGFVFWVIVGLGFALGDFAGVVGTIVYAGFQLYFMKTYRQTLGKYWLNIRVLDYSTNQPVSFGKYVVREILDLILQLTGLNLISVIVVFVSRERRSLTDAIMSTIVVKTL
ncbi:RDD family protein [Haemophilus haemolyticus]|uniref:RDD family protein n=1 Tax=Haemophilus haemolyticus TaxID=726 RepID=UPI000E59347D|nr:RDD family protein [Haemophilus haemolyticus]